jgi:hypothetical protein
MLERIGVERRGLGVRIDWRRFVPWLIGALGVATVIAIIVRVVRRRRAPTRPEVQIYMSVLALMQRRGRARREHESPSAWAARLAREGAAEAATLDVFARLYEGLRFGEQEPSAAELGQLRALAGQLREP